MPTVNSVQSKHDKFAPEVKHYDKVLIVSPVFTPHIANGGGVAITYGALEKQLLARGCDVKVLSPRRGSLEGWAPDYYDTFSCINPCLSNLWKLWKEVENTDIVVCPDNSVLLYVALYTMLLNKPFQYNVHTNVPDAARHSGAPMVLVAMIDLFFKVSSWLATDVYTTSFSYEQRLKAIGYNCTGTFSPRFKTAVFEEPDTEEAMAEAREWMTDGDVDKPLLLFVGRWSAEKQIELLVETKPARANLCIVGDGPQGDELELLHDPANGVIVKRGIVNQARLRVLYKACDVFVSASKFETLGMTVCESILCGTPVVVENANGFKSQVKNGINGYLCYFDNHDETRELIDRVLDMQWDEEALKVSNGTSNDAAKANLAEIVLTEREASPLRRWFRTLAALVLIPLMALYWVVSCMLSAVIGKNTQYDSKGNCVASSKSYTPVFAFFLLAIAMMVSFLFCDPLAMLS